VYLADRERTDWVDEIPPNAANSDACRRVDDVPCPPDAVGVGDGVIEGSFEKRRLLEIIRDIKSFRRKPQSYD